MIDDISLHSKSQILEEQLSIFGGMWHTVQVLCMLASGVPWDLGLGWLWKGWQRASCEQAEGVSCGHHSNTYPFLQEPCVKHLPRLYLDIHVRGGCLPGGGAGVGRDPVPKDARTPSSHPSGY